MRKFKQLTLKERYQIAAYKEAGYSQKYIANYIGVLESTISRDVKRTAKIDTKQKLKEDWSPEQISGVMKKIKWLGFKTPSEIFYTRVSRLMAA